LDIAELRLALNPAHRHLAPADFDNACDIAKRITRINNAKVFPTTERRPRQWETLIEIYRKGKIAEALWTF
jgi:hypothetical protein